MKFKDMPYARPDVEAICAAYRKLTERVQNAAAAADVFAAIEEHEKLSMEFATMESICYIRHTVNTTDEFYTAEMAYIDENSPLVQEQRQAFSLAVLTSPFRADIDARYGELMLRNVEIGTKTFSPAIIAELQEENRLVSAYQKLSASSQIDFDGKVLTVAELAPYKQSPDREVRHAAYLAEGSFWMSVKDELDRLFDELVKVRAAIAEKLGYASFTEVAYLRNTRNCYDPAMVEKFRAQVKRDLVPVVTAMKKKQAERIGLTGDFRFYDDAFGYPEGNPKPHGTPDDILAAGKQMYHEMSPETAEFVDFLYDNELFDVCAKKGKAPGGYCTSLPIYRAPFIFSNFNGTSGDVDVLTHEAGHAFAGHRARNFELLEQTSPSMESCEVHSMSMEFLAWPWLNLYYKEDADRARYAHLESTLIFIPYGTMVDEFQHHIYANPKMTAAERDALWMSLEKEYRPYIDFADVPFYNAGAGWQRQLHIYHYPFYYIDYCLAQTIALEVWAESQTDYASAWARYLRFVEQGGKQTFVELCRTAGFVTPFEEGCLKQISDTVTDWLSKNG